jgi:hypothetical protein
VVITGNRNPATPAEPAQRAAPARAAELKAATARRIRRTAAEIDHTHPELEAAGHLRDAAKMLDYGSTDGAKRHLDAAMEMFTPRNLIRHGITDDDGHTTGKQAMHAAHRHRLAVQDVEDLTARNNRAAELAAIRRTALAASSPQSLSGPGPQTGAGPTEPASVMNAPANNGIGKPDGAARGPASPDRRGSKQISGSGVGTIAIRNPPDRTSGSRRVQGAAGLSNVYDLAWVANPSKAQWAVIDAHSGHLPDKGGSDEEKADNHIADARKASQMGMHQAAIGHLARASTLTSDSGKQAHINQLNTAVAKVALGRGQGRAIGLSAETGRLAVTPAPRGRPGGPGLYDVRGMGHTAYYQQIVKALIEKRGMPPGKAYAIARGALRKWAAGGGHVHPEVRAAAAAAEGGELARQARAKSSHSHTSHGHANDGWATLGRLIELAAWDHELRGKDGKWASSGGEAAEAPAGYVSTADMEKRLAQERNQMMANIRQMDRTHASMAVQKALKGARESHAKLATNDKRIETRKAVIKVATAAGATIAGSALAYAEARLGVPTGGAVASAAGPPLVQALVEWVKGL